MGLYSADAHRSAHHLPAAVRKIERGEYIIGEDDEKLSAYKSKHNQRLRNDDIKKQIFMNSGGRSLRQGLEDSEFEMKKRWRKEEAVSGILLTPSSRSGRNARARCRSVGAGARRRQSMAGSGRSSARRGRQGRGGGSIRGGSIRGGSIRGGWSQITSNIKERSKSVARGLLRRARVRGVQGEEEEENGQGGNDNSNINMNNSESKPAPPASAVEEAEQSMREDETEDDTEEEEDDDDILLMTPPKKVRGKDEIE